MPIEDIVNDKTLFVLAFTASDFGRWKRHISLQNPSASAGGFIVSEITYFAYYILYDKLDMLERIKIAKVKGEQELTEQIEIEEYHIKRRLKKYIANT